MLSPFARNLWDKLNSQKDGRKRTNVKKLVSTLGSKNHYVVHYRNPQQYLELGLKVSKIHKILSFDQSPWLKPYIDFNTQKRKESKNEFEKDFFKLMINACFGKTMENVRKYLVNGKKRLRKLCSKSSFMRFKIFNENLVGIENRKVSLKLDKPFFCGQAVLDLSKVIMYDFHYNFIRKKYKDNAVLLFTDTDSLCYLIRTRDIYQDISENRHLFDLSNYHQDHPLCDTTNKKKPGFFKDETGGCAIKEFVGLRSKMYSFTFMNEEKKKPKGISKTTVERDLRHSHYVNVLFNRSMQTCEMHVIRSRGHELTVNRIRKSGLSAFDDKRYLLDDGISSYAYFHYKTTV